jgi:asparagine synthase (glutamine-hydrolysing)
MCGICGIFYPDRQSRVDREALAVMNQQIAYRGPDDDGFFVRENVGLAMRRLSIIDIQTGRQPIGNEDETIWIVFNGEIYNHRELRRELESRGHRYRTRSDTETIVHLYEEYGNDCVKHLRGMFAFAIWDQAARRLFLARDRLGIKPLYYCYDGKSLLFGSEIKALMAYPGIRAEFNRNTLAEYLAFGYITGEETMYAGVRKLMPGHTLTLDERGELTVSSYWDLQNDSHDVERTRESYVREYRERLEEGISSHLMSDVPLGVFLSGGLDSSAVAALTTKIRKDRIETFAVGYEEEEFSELPFARAVAEHIGAEHREVRLSRDDFFQTLPLCIWHEDEPVAWPSSVSLLFVSRLARQRVKVVLTGEGSDETLGGYTRYAWTLHNSRLDNIYRSVTTPGVRRMVHDGILASPLTAAARRKLDHTFLMRDGSSWPAFYFDNFYSAFSVSEQSDLLTPAAKLDLSDAYAASVYFFNQSSGELFHRLLYADIKSYLVELLMKQDQMSMAASIESRVPFLDHQLVEFTASIPAKYSIKGMAGKIILKSAIEDLLPKSIVHRRKMGFPTPWAHWLAGPQLDSLERLLLEPRTSNRGYFRTEAIQLLFAEHRARHRDHGNRIWRLLNLELWMRVCLERDAVAAATEPRAAVVLR